MTKQQNTQNRQSVNTGETEVVAVRLPKSFRISMEARAVEMKCSLSEVIRTRLIAAGMLDGMIISVDKGMADELLALNPGTRGLARLINSLMDKEIGRIHTQRRLAESRARTNQISFMHQDLRRQTVEAKAKVAEMENRR